MTALDIFLYAASACALIVTAEIIYKACRAAAKPAPAPESELDRLIQDERLDAGLKFIQGWNGEMPVDVKRVTIVLHYDDGKSLTMECHPNQIGVRL